MKVKTLKVINKSGYVFTERRIKTFRRCSCYDLKKQHLLKEELKYLEDVFVMKNNFPIWVVKKILKEEKEKIDNKNNADKNKRIFKQM